VPAATGCSKAAGHQSAAGPAYHPAAGAGAGDRSSVTPPSHLTPTQQWHSPSRESQQHRIVRCHFWQAQGRRRGCSRALCCCQGSYWRRTLCCSKPRVFPRAAKVESEPGKRMAHVQARHGQSYWWLLPVPVLHNVHHGKSNIALHVTGARSHVWRRWAVGPGRPLWAEQELACRCACCSLGVSAAYGSSRAGQLRCMPITACATQPAASSQQQWGGLAPSLIHCHHLKCAESTGTE
jgi:hypothetical protein